MAVKNQNYVTGQQLTTTTENNVSDDAVNIIDNIHGQYTFGNIIRPHISDQCKVNWEHDVAVGENDFSVRYKIGGSLGSGVNYFINVPLTTNNEAVNAWKSVMTIAFPKAIIEGSINTTLLSIQAVIKNSTAGGASVGDAQFRTVIEIYDPDLTLDDTITHATVTPAVNDTYETYTVQDIDLSSYMTNQLIYVQLQNRCNVDLAVGEGVASWWVFPRVDSSNR